MPGTGVKKLTSAGTDTTAEREAVAVTRTSGTSAAASCQLHQCAPYWSHSGLSIAQIWRIHGLHSACGSADKDGRPVCRFRACLFSRDFHIRDRVLLSAKALFPGRPRLRADVYVLRALR